jgi:LmbE family N-acetylglucosaminyl deacetylase
VFLLAHQDDEVFLLPHIMDSEQKLFIYLTSGVSEGSSELKLQKRTSEAKALFQKYLAEFNAHVIWWGSENSVPEGKLHTFVSEENLSHFEKVIRNQDAQITQIVTTTFEGAHQDHDSAAVISRALAKAFQVNCIEMSTYPQWFSKFYSFKVLNPHAPEEEFPLVRLRTLVMALKLMASYKTQRKTWLGLGPATLGAFIFRNYESSQQAPVAVMRNCFYEFRGRANQGEVLRYLASIK